MDKTYTEDCDCVREKTIADRIYDLANPNLCHDYTYEAGRIVEMYEDEKAAQKEQYWTERAKWDYELACCKQIIRALTEKIAQLEDKRCD